MDIKKAKGTSDTTQSDHIERKIIPKNADPTRTHLNRVLVEYPDGVHGRDEAIAHRLNTAGIRRKITHDQVRVVRVVLSGTHEDMMNIQEKGELDEWCSDSIQWLQATFGKDNVVAAHLHMDEKTPHIHAAVVPIVTGERRKAKKEQTDGKRKYRKKTNSVRLCADDLFNRQTLVAYHDNYARVMAKYGLQRGVRGSEARHTTTMQYYRDLKKKNEVLETETRLLQEKKAKAQEELKVFERAVHDVLDLTMTSFKNGDLNLARQVEPLEEVIDGLSLDVKQRHVRRLRKGKCTIELGFILSDVITNFERVSDHCSNIAVCLVQVNEDEFDTHAYLDELRQEDNKDFQSKVLACREKYQLPPTKQERLAEKNAKLLAE